MQLVSALAEGVTGADGGTAELYLQSDDSRAVYYLDHLGNFRVSSGLDVELDAYGSACVYVDDIVRVVVKDADGATVREFVDSCSAAATDYSGPSATGSDYVTAVAATNAPTTIQRVFNRWYIDASGINFLISSSRIESIADSIGGMLRLRVNAKAFGGGFASGEDITEPLSKAIAFAASIGGAVVLPPCLCNISATIVVPSGVSIVGTGRGASVLRMTADGVSAFSFQSAAVAPAVLASMQVNRVTLTSDVPLIQVLPGSKVRIRECTLGGSSRRLTLAVVAGSNPTLNASTELIVEDCFIDMLLCGIHDYRRERPDLLPVYRRCTFEGNFWPTTMAEVAYGRFEDCVFKAGFGNYVGIGVQEPIGYARPDTASETAEEPRVIVRRCTFSNSGDGRTSYGFSYQLSSYEQNGGLFEDQCTFGGAVTPYQLLGSKRANGRLGSSESRVVRTTSNATTVNIDVTAHTVVLTRTSTAVQSALIQSSADGAVRRLFVHNNSGGAITQTVRSVDGTDAGDFPLGAAGVAMANGTWRLWEWVQWPLDTEFYSETETPEAHFAVICDGTAVGSPA